MKLVISRIIFILCVIAVIALLTYINFSAAETGEQIRSYEPVQAYISAPVRLTAVKPAALSPEPSSVPEPAEEPPKEYKADERIVTMIAKMMYGECRGVSSVTQKAAVAWVPFNRYDNPSPYDWPHDLEGIITQTGAFEAYHPDNPVWPELYELAEDVMIRWLKEQDGQTDVGRVVPVEYTYFTSDGHGNNVFRDAFRKADANIWDWKLPSPYES